MRALRRARRLLGPAFHLKSVPDVVHVLAAAGTARPPGSESADETAGSAFARPWGTLPSSGGGDGVGVRGLRTLRTADMPGALPGVDAAGDLFLLCLFRAASSHVLTSGANLRAEPDLEMSLFPGVFREGGEGEEGEDAHETQGLVALRAGLGLPGVAPVPIVLTRSGEGLDFSAPFFTRCASSPASGRRDVAPSPPPKQFQDPVLLVSTDSARRDVERRIAAVPAAHARVYSADFAVGGGNGIAPVLTPPLALDFARKVLGAQRISVECGPSITSELHNARAIKAVSLSILVAAEQDPTSRRRVAPVLDSDPLFDGLNSLMESRHAVTGGSDSSDDDALLQLESSVTSYPGENADAEFGWVYEFWARQMHTTAAAQSR